MNQLAHVPAATPAHPAPESGGSSCSEDPTRADLALQQLKRGFGSLLAMLIWSYVCFRLCLFAIREPGGGVAVLAAQLVKAWLPTLPLSLMRALSVGVLGLLSAAVLDSLRWLAGFGGQVQYAANVLAAGYLAHILVGAASLVFPAILKASWWGFVYYLLALHAFLMFLGWSAKRLNAESKHITADGKPIIAEEDVPPLFCWPS